MTCREIIDFLMQYLDGELVAEQRTVFEEHLGDCPECVCYIKTYQETVYLARAACPPDDPDCPEVPEALVKAIVAACRGGGERPA
jgi:anti-sigma factor RsiW